MFAFAGQSEPSNQKYRPPADKRSIKRTDSVSEGLREGNAVVRRGICRTIFARCLFRHCSVELRVALSKIICFNVVCVSVVCIFWCLSLFFFVCETNFLILNYYCFFFFFWPKFSPIKLIQKRNRYRNRHQWKVVHRNLLRTIQPNVDW